MFKIGDTVKVICTTIPNTTTPIGHLGLIVGTVIKIRPDNNPIPLLVKVDTMLYPEMPDYNKWWFNKFDLEHYHRPMIDPDFSLEEMELAQTML